MGLFARVNQFPPLFLIGAPRCGTTLAGLYVAARFRWAHLPNVAKQHPKRPLPPLRAALAEGAWSASFDNRYGVAEGPLAPSDGWDVINRWFPTYVEAGREDARRARGFRDLVARLEELYSAPFFLKNNHNTMRVGALAELFPDAGFVMIKRDLPSAVHSLLEARRRHQVPLGKWWSAAPPQFLGRHFETELEQAAATVWGLENYVERRFGALVPARHTSVDYGSFCADPSRLSDWIEARYKRLGVPLEPGPGLTGGPAGLPTSFEPSRLEPGEREALEAELEPIVAKLTAELDHQGPRSRD